MKNADPDKIIEKLKMQPHPEGGHYVETYRDHSGKRGTVSCIYFLLKKGEISAWHRIDATEIWHHVDGAPLTLTLSKDRKTEAHHILGNNVLAEEKPHIVIPPFQWQSAKSNGDWTLVSCIVAPAFTFEGFEMDTSE